MYYLDRGQGLGLIIPPKTASNSLLAALRHSRLGYAIAGGARQRGEAEASGCAFYASIRHPLARIIEFNRTPMRVAAGRAEDYPVFAQRVIAGDYDANPHVMLQSGMLIGEPVYIIRFEHLHADYSALCALVDGHGELPHRNPGDGIPWEEKYLALPVDLQNALAEKVMPDLERFGYVRPV
ncbi:MAG: hypothetical protein AB7Q00_15050 [Phycisphaerales bacterium]